MTVEEKLIEIQADHRIKTNELINLLYSRPRLNKEIVKRTVEIQTLNTEILTLMSVSQDAKVLNIPYNIKRSAELYAVKTNALTGHEQDIVFKAYCKGAVDYCDV